MKRACVVLLALASSGAIDRGAANAGDATTTTKTNATKATAFDEPATTTTTSTNSWWPVAVTFDAKETPASMALAVVVEHGDVVRLSGDGLVALRSESGASVAEGWTAMKIDLPAATSEDGELPPLAWELVKPMGLGQAPRFAHGLVHLVRAGGHLDATLERRPDRPRVDDLVSPEPVCDAFSAGDLGFTVVCAVRGRATATNLTGAHGLEGVAVASSPLWSVVLLDLAPRHDRDAGAIVTVDGARTVFRAEATWLGGEVAPTLTLGKSSS